MQTSIAKNQAAIKKRRTFTKYISLYIMMIPFILYYAIFCYKPMYGLLIAFQDYSLFKGISGSDWVGLEHFKRFLSTPYFFRTMKNTIVLNLLALAFTFPAPIIFAVLLNEIRIKSVKKVVQTMSYMPHFISSVVIVGIVVNLLSPSYGLIPILIEKISGTRPYLLVDPKYFRTIYMTMSVWQTVGYGSVVYIAAITGIDTQLYEAAVIDGANKFKQIWHITLPGILPTIMTMFILRIGGILSSATDTILLLQQPSTYEVSDVIGTYVYRVGLIDGSYSYATAVSIFNSIIGMILVWITNVASKKFTETGIW